MKKTCTRLLLGFAVSLVLFSGCAPKWDIQNPYEKVDWENHQQYKANLHTHTTRSDGGHSPQDIVDRYHELGYKILAITDHNEVTYPWISFTSLSPSEKTYEKLEDDRIDSAAVVYENRNPAELKMFAIQGNEVSSPHHIGSFFTDFQDPGEEEKATLDAIGKKNGLTLLHHPGRYTGRNPEKYNVDWYVDIFTTYEYVTGMEVYNQGDRYTHDRELWDNVLLKTMPQRPVWGYSNDDYHGGIVALGRNWNTFILPELSEESIRKGMLEGCFFYTYASNGHKGRKTPEIKRINVNDRKGVIEIIANGQDSVHWISGGNVVGRGNSIKLSDVADLDSYIRAEIYGPESVTGTQPFGIKRN